MTIDLNVFLAAKLRPFLRDLQGVRIGITRSWLIPEGAVCIPKHDVAAALQVLSLITMAAFFLALRSFVGLGFIVTAALLLVFIVFVLRGVVAEAYDILADRIMSSDYTIVFAPRRLRDRDASQADLVRYLIDILRKQRRAVNEHDMRIKDWQDNIILLRAISGEEAK
ncbi:MAG: hypothetical protein WCC94_00755 [Candidatus Bathyarchaeia archaeon]